MKKKILAFLFAVFFICFSVSAWAVPTVYDFEDLYPGNEDHGLIGSGYFGSNINQSPSWHWVTSGYRPLTGYDYGTIGKVSSFSAYGNDLWLETTDGSTFDFVGCYLTAAWNEGLNILVTGLLDGTDMFSELVVVDPYSPTWFSLNFTGIDELIFSSSGGTNADLGGSGGHFVGDNHTFGQPIPEPATMILLGSGLLGLAGIFRKKFIK